MTNPARPHAVLAVALALLALPARGEEAPCPFHPKPAAAAARYARATAKYDLPRVTLLDQDGRRVPLQAALAADGPLAVNFIFTTCNTVCPVMSASFSGLARQLGSEDDLRMVSISIDPEHDRPGTLKAYAQRFAADRRWSFYTGTAADVGAVITAFDALRGDKTSHRPLTLLRRAGSSEWIRIEGLPSAAELASELRSAHAER